MVGWMPHHILLWQGIKNGYIFRLLDHIQKALKKGKTAKSPDLLKLCEKLLSEGKDITSLLSLLVESESR